MTASGRHPVDRFLAEISAGRGITTNAWADDARLGATVPHRRLERTVFCGGRRSATLLAEMEADRVL